MPYPDAPSIAESILRQASLPAEKPESPVAEVAAEAAQEAQSRPQGGEEKDPLRDALNGLLKGGSAETSPQAAQFTKVQQALQAEQQKSLALEVAAVQQYLARFPEGSPERAKAQYEADVWATQRMAQLQVAQERGAREALEGALLPLVQETIYTQTAQKYGIPKDVLKKYASTPQELAKLVEGWTELKKVQNFEKRAAAKIDSAPTGAQAEGKPRAGADEIKKKYQGSGDIKGYLRELQKAAR